MSMKKGTTHANHETITLGDGDINLALRGNHNHISLGNGTDVVSVLGDHNHIAFGDGHDTLSLQGNHNRAELGNGNDGVTLSGNHDQVTVGAGTNSIHLSPNSQHDTITVGAGNNTITTSNRDSANTFNLNASTTSLVLHGTNNLVSVDGGTDTITDTTASSRPVGDHLVLDIGSSGGVINITNFSAASGVVDLASNLGFSSAAAAAAALTSDGHGGSLLTFAGSLGDIDFQGVAVSSLLASNFRIT
jgi:hypothetical protein